MHISSFFRASRVARAAVVLFVVSSLSACAPANSGGQALADKSGDAIGCEAFQQTFWDEMDQIALEDRTYPTEEAMRAEFDRALAQGRLAKLSNADRS
ncbi:MAG: hypothetical protein V4760_13130, partial [Bdellovibrionota bacterium]